MGVALTSTVEAQLVSGTWTDLSADVLGEVRGKYGIDGNGPADCVASSGQLTFDLDNSAQNSGATLGWYSPASSSVRTGWTFGIPIRWVVTYESAASVTSITRAGAVATVTTGAAHGRSTDDWVTIAGAAQSDYNGTFQITVTGGSTFTYAVGGTPATPATGTITWVRAYVRFRGRVADINPTPGRYRDRRVHVVAQDPIADLMDADVREVTLQSSKTETELITALLAAMPTTAQPPDTSLETGVDTYPYSFDNVGDGAKAAGLIRDVALSALGAVYCRGDGTLVYKTRHSRALVTSAFGFSDSTVVDLAVPSSLDSVFNRVRVTIHPKTVDAAATTVLWAQTGSAPEIAAGATLTIWGTYYDPGNTLKLIGGLSQVVPIVATTDYTANSAADGSGSNLTADISVVTTAFASTAKFEVTNGGATAAYLTKLQVRGKGVYDNGPRTSQSYTAKDYGDRPFDLDMPYQDDPEIAQSAATYLDAQFNDLEDQAEAIEFVATSTSALLAQALLREPTDCVTITETLTGLSAVGVIIQSVELAYEARQLRCRWTLAPAAPFNFWQLGVAGASELGSTTVLGF